ncbi:MAG: hypothetical protein NTW85_06555 [Methylococcales bacterium]|nr:hypothetical protein [Methylococcales bacterium]
MPTVNLGGRSFIINEPVFKDLKNILAALNRLNNPSESDFNLVSDIQLILTSLIGEDNVAKFKHFWWQVWKLPPPSSNEITALLAAIPAICGLQQHSTAGSQSSSNQSTDWDALYWRVIRQTGWTWETVDTTMTVSRLAALSESLNNAPTVDSLVAAYLGYDYSKPRTLEDEVEAYLATQPTHH